MDLPIGERTWGLPTAWSAKVGEIATSRGIGGHRGANGAEDMFIRPLFQLAAFAAIMMVL